jgi:hypothetical protein
MTAYAGLRAEAPLKWMRELRPLGIGATVKSVGRELALYASPDGTGARPGVQRLAWACDLSTRSVMRSLAEMERAGLLYCVERGSKNGRRGRASNYTLTLHDDLWKISKSFEEWKKEHGSGDTSSRDQAENGSPQPDPWNT